MQKLNHDRSCAASPFFNSLLEAEVQAYQDRAFRAEKWLLRVYKEIEDQFFKDNRGSAGQSAQR